MATMKDAGGNDVEVFTEAEVAAREAAALETYKKEHPDQSEALTEAQTALEKAKTDLVAATAAGGNDKDQNFAALRLAVKAAEDKAEKVRTDALSEIEKVKNAPTIEYKTELFETLSKGDKTLKEKIDINYKNLAGMPEGTKAEVRARMEHAYKLSTNDTMPTVFDGGTGAGNRGNGGMPQAGDGPKETENGKEQRLALSITDEQAKKYAPKPGQPGYVA